MLAFSRPVSDFMSSPVHTIGVDASVDEAAARLSELHVSSLLAVTADGRAAGVLSRTDLLQRAGGRVGDQMSQPVVSAEVSDSVAVAARTMLERRIHRVYVLSAGRALGVLSTREVMLAVRESRIDTPLSAMMSSPVIAIDFDRPAAEASALLDSESIGGVVVVENDHPVGMYTQREALAARDLPAGTRVEDAMSPALMCLRTTVPAHRAAAFTVSTRARTIVVTHHHDMKGVVSGMDFVRLVATGTDPSAERARVG